MQKKDKNYLLVICIIIVIALFTIIMQYKKDKKLDYFDKEAPIFKEEIYEYSNKLSNNEVHFSINIDSDWIVEEDNGWDASEGIEASPDCGIRILLCNDNTSNIISIMGSIPKVSIKSLKYDIVELFKTNDNIEGKNYIMIDDKEVVQKIILYGSRGINYYFLVKTDKEIYENNNEIIQKVLKSFTPCNSCTERD